MSSGVRPTFLVAGAARSGTTAVVERLRRHPDVFVTDPKEPHFLAYGEGPLDFRGPGDDATVNRLAVTDPDGYRALFAGSDAAVARGEGSVSTLYRAEEAVDRIERFAPGAHVVVILREPAERAFSAFQYLRARGFEPYEDFDRALDDEPRRIADRWQHLWHYVGMGRYGAQLCVFADALGPGRLNVFFHDHLVADGDRVLGELQRAIGVTPLATGRGGPPVNASGEPRSALVQAVVRFPTRHPRLRSLGRRLVPYSAWQRLRSANLAESAVPAASAARIRAELDDDARQLRAVLADLGSGVHGELPTWLGPPHR